MLNSTQTLNDSKSTTQAINSPTNFGSINPSDLQPVMRNQSTNSTLNSLPPSKPKQATNSKTVSRPPSPFQQYKEKLPLSLQEFKISDYEDGMSIVIAEFIFIRNFLSNYHRIYSYFFITL